MQDIELRLIASTLLCGPPTTDDTRRRHRRQPEKYKYIKFTSSSS